MRFQEIVESQHTCPHCGGPMFSEMVMTEKKDACYYKVKASAKVWPSAYASGRLVQCRKKGAANYGNKNESAELSEEFDLIESIIERLAEHNGVDAEVIWEDLETLTEDELYAFAVTSEPIMESQEKGEYGRVLDALGIYYPRLSIEELNTPGYYKVIANKANVPVEYAAQVIDGFANDDRYYDDEDDEEQGMAEDWQKANKRDRTAGMSQKAVNAYRRENPGSKLKTAVTTKPSKLKRGSKASKRRKSYCSRSRGQMKMHSISCAKTPDKAICKARRRWNC